METEAEKAERWYLEYEVARAALWKAQAERDKYLEIIRAVREEAASAEKRKRDVPPSALWWATREVEN